jgi:hypothetical protein
MLASLANMNRITPARPLQTDLSNYSAIELRDKLLRLEHQLPVSDKNGVRWCRSAGSISRILGAVGTTSPLVLEKSKWSSFIQQPQFTIGEAWFFHQLDNRKFHLQVNSGEIRHQRTHIAQESPFI